jgi:hypothetical protein
MCLSANLQMYAREAAELVYIQTRNCNLCEIYIQLDRTRYAARDPLINDLKLEFLSKHIVDATQRRSSID